MNERCGWMREGCTAQCVLESGHEGTHDWGEMSTWASLNFEDLTDYWTGTQTLPDLSMERKREMEG